MAFGLLAAVMGLCAFHASAQVLKTDKKYAKDAKVEPKADPKEGPKIEWPKSIQGKNLDAWVKEISAKDASTREAAIRVLPLFGPDARKATSLILLNTIKSATEDVSVRMAAIEVVPLLGLEKSELDAGLDAMVSIIKPGSGFDRHFRMGTVAALGSCGPIARRAIPVIATGALRDTGSWQMRKVAAFALGRLGLPMKEDEGPDIKAVDPLSEALNLGDSSHLVRKEIINSLLVLGPPHVEASWKKERESLSKAMRDTDHVVAIWAHVVFIRTEQQLIKRDDKNLDAVARYLTNPDIALRIEALQALGTLGNEAKTRWQDIASICKDSADAVAKADKEKVRGEDLALATTCLWALSRMPDETGKILPIVDGLKRHSHKAIENAAEEAYKILTQDPKNPVIDPKKGPPKDSKKP
jgi:hypothetical protein